MTFFKTTKLNLKVTEGEIVLNRPAWLYIKDRKEVKIIKLGDSYYRHRFKGYFCPIDHTVEESKSFFNNIAPIYDSICVENKQLGKYLLEALKDRPKNISILDIMGGTGLPNEILYKNGFQNMTLLDIADKMLEIAKNKMPNIKTIEADFEQFNTMDKFDVAVSVLGIHYKKNGWNSFAKNISKFLKVNGLLVIIESENVASLENFKLIKKRNFDWYSGHRTTDLNYYVFQSTKSI